MPRPRAERGPHLHDAKHTQLTQRRRLIRLPTLVDSVEGRLNGIELRKHLRAQRVANFLNFGLPSLGSPPLETVQQWWWARVSALPVTTMHANISNVCIIILVQKQRLNFRTRASPFTAGIMNSMKALIAFLACVSGL